MFLSDCLAFGVDGQWVLIMQVSLHSGRAVKALTENFEERGSLEISVEARQYEVQKLQTVCEVGSCRSCGGMSDLVVCLLLSSIPGVQVAGTCKAAAT